MRDFCFGIPRLFLPFKGLFKTEYKTSVLTSYVLGGKVMDKAKQMKLIDVYKRQVVTEPNLRASVNQNTTSNTVVTLCIFL